MLGVAVSPSYDRDHRVFFYASTSEDNRVLRTTYRNGSLGRMDPILTGIPNAFNHDGGRMIFGPDGWLYVSTGEAGQPELAQDMGSLGGKILRIGQDGKPAEGNPDPSSPIWTSGHRNVQGLAFDHEGNLWASEFGQDTWDELNLIKRGFNYGWPEVEGKGSKTPDFTDPQVQWRTDDASPSGLAFLDGRLWLGALRGERLWRVDVNGQQASDEKAFFVGKYGRLRTVVRRPRRQPLGHHLQPRRPRRPRLRGRPDPARPAVSCAPSRRGRLSHGSRELTSFPGRPGIPAWCHRRTVVRRPKRPGVTRRWFPRAPGKPSPPAAHT